MKKLFLAGLLMLGSPAVAELSTDELELKLKISQCDVVRRKALVAMEWRQNYVPIDTAISKGLETFTRPESGQEWVEITGIAYQYKIWESEAAKVEIVRSFAESLQASCLARKQ